MSSITIAIGLSVGTAVALATARLLIPPSRDGRALRNHLRSLSYAFALLGIYYSAAAILPHAMERPFDPREWPVDPNNFAGSYSFHVIALLVCWLTNHLLAEAVLALQPTQAAPPVLPRLDVVLTRDGIVLSLLLSLGVLGYPPVVGQGWFLAPVIAYMTQLCVSSALFLRLAQSYRDAGCNALFVVTVRFYAFLQMYYPVRHLLPGQEATFLYVLTAAKPLVGLSAIVACLRLGSRLSRSSDIDEDLTALGDALCERARLRRAGHAAAGLIVAGLVMWVTLGVADAALQQAFGPPHSIPARLTLIAAAVPVGAMIVQTIGYFALRTGASGVKWQRLADLQLASVITCLAGPEHEGWSNLDLRAAGTPQVRGPNSRDGSKVQVVLLHGIFSSGPQAWGLLPALLLRSGRVDRVRLLSYKHSLWSGATRFQHVKRDTEVLLRQIVEQPEGETVVFAHSLGGLLTLAALHDWVASGREGLLRKLRNVVFVAPPLHGSPLAWLGFPHHWPSMLRTGAAFVDQLGQRLFEHFPPPGQICGEDVGLCSIAFLQGIRDTVVGTGAPFRGLPGATVPLGGWHSTVNAVYRADGPLFEAYQRELDRPRRPVELMHMLSSHLAGRRVATTCLLFEFSDGLGKDLKNAFVRPQPLAQWGKRIHGPQSIPPNEALHDAVVRNFMKDVVEDMAPPHAIVRGEEYWEELSHLFQMSREKCELVRRDWPEAGSGRTLYLYANSYAGFALIVKEDLASLRQAHGEA